MAVSWFGRLLDTLANHIKKVAARQRRRADPWFTYRNLHRFRPTVELLEKRLAPANLSTLTSFPSFIPEGANPYGGLILDGSGDLFGTTYQGGASGQGTVFEMSPVSGGYNLSTLVSFNGTNGAKPYAGLVLDSSGKLFGTTSYGGDSNAGTVFELSPVSGGGYNLTTLVSFNGSNGAFPNARLILDSSGDLFGTTSYGGTLGGYGTVFEMSPVSGGGYNLITLISFDGTNGDHPEAGLVLDGSGNLFGTTAGVVSQSNGTVFELSPVSGGGYNLTTLVFFNYANGANPYGDLVRDSAGNLFGTTYAGGFSSTSPVFGTVFELSPSSGGGYNLTTLVSFDNSTAEHDPYGGLVLDSSGDLFGTTYLGKTVFEMSPVSGGSYNLSTLLSFTTTNGIYPYGTDPYAGLVLDSSGNLFGTTVNGGDSNVGTVFGLSPVSGGGYKLTTLISLNGTNGNGPTSGLVLDSGGDLFGTTAAHGTFGNGSVFELSPVSGGGYSLTTLVSFNYTNGEYPNAGLVRDSSGDLFGTAVYGGDFGNGTVFELSPVSGGGYSFTTLISFNSTGGANPFAGLILDSSGDLFGTTGGGGDLGDGTVFELSPASGGGYSLTTLISFNYTDGANPYGGLVLDSNGNLFGTTQSGPTNAGTVFELTPASGAGYILTTLVAFNYTNGANPSANLILDGSGDLFGTTSYSGSYSNAGTVFELSPVSGGGYNLSTLVAFNNGNGYYPRDALVLDSYGDLFGTTFGSSPGQGTVFKLSLVSGGGYNLSTLVSFTGANGATPYCGLVLDSSGDLFGTTSGGGALGRGTVFELTAPTLIASTAILAMSASTITLTGTGFDPTAANNSVTFTTLGAAGTVTNVNAAGTQMTVTFTTQPKSIGALSAYVTSDGVPSNTIQVATVPTDIFNRVGPDLGPGWQMPPLPEKFHFAHRRRLGFGSFQLQGGQAVSVGMAANGEQLAGVSKLNPTLQADVSLGGAQNLAVGLMARVQSNGDAYVAVLTSAGYAEIWLFREANNTYTPLATSLSPVVDTSGTLQFVVNGPSLTLTFTGSGPPVVVTANDPTLNGPGGVGIFAQGPGGSIGNFSVNDT
jgi:uncharacterized repeat protein (TIGR03803 family)